jgi:hypothetical protein
VDGTGLMRVHVPVAVAYFQTSPFSPSYGPPLLLYVT